MTSNSKRRAELDRLAALMRSNDGKLPDKPPNQRRQPQAPTTGPLKIRPS